MPNRTGNLRLLTGCAPQRSPTTIKCFGRPGSPNPYLAAVSNLGARINPNLEQRAGFEPTMPTWKAGLSPRRSTANLAPWASHTDGL